MLLGEPQHSALGTAAHQETTEAANLSALDDNTSASDSADNHSAAATARRTTDKRYDERIARSEGDVGGCDTARQRRGFPAISWEESPWSAEHRQRHVHAILQYSEYTLPRTVVHMRSDSLAYIFCSPRFIFVRIHIIFRAAHHFAGDSRFFFQLGGTPGHRPKRAQVGGSSPKSQRPSPTCGTSARHYSRRTTTPEAQDNTYIAGEVAHSTGRRQNIQLGGDPGHQPKRTRIWDILSKSFLQDPPSPRQICTYIFTPHRLQNAQANTYIAGTGHAKYRLCSYLSRLSSQQAFPKFPFPLPPSCASACAFFDPVFPWSRCVFALC